MSKKKNLEALEDPEMIISSDGEEESETDDSDSASEEVVPDDAVTATASEIPAKSAASESGSGSEAESGSNSGSETESGSDSDMEEEPSKAVTATTTSSKPKKKEVLASSAAQSSGAAASTPPPPALRSALKRPATASEATSTGMKRGKTVEESDSKKSCIQRVWTEEDEIRLLKGMIDFNASKGNPFNNMDEYFDSVKTSFSFEPPKDKFLRKIRGLRDKYRYKGPFTKVHDKESMGLAKLIWGPGSFAFEPSVVKFGNGKSKKSEKEKKKKPDSLKKPVEEEAEKSEKEKKKKKKKVEEEEEAGKESPTVGLESDWFEKSLIVQSIASHGLDEAYVKQKWSSTPMEDKKILEEKYKLLNNKKVEWLELETKFFYEFTSRVFKSS